MPFLFDVDHYHGIIKEKYLEAKLHIQTIHRSYPDIKEADDVINKMERDLRLMKTGLLKSREEEIIKKEKDLERLKRARLALLERYEIPANYKEPNWDCPQCQDSGLFLSNQGQQISCHCIEKRRFQLYLEGSMLPQRLKKARFDKASFNFYSSKERVPSGKTYQEQAELVHKKARKFVKNLSKGDTSRGLLIYGPVGSGKSYLLGCIANEALFWGIEVQYIVYNDLLEDLRHTFSKKEITFQEIIQKTQNVPLLLIDDLGTESSSEFTANTLYSIIDYRYREEKPLVISTNLQIDKIKDKFALMGDRISQRILEICDYLPLMGQIRLEMLRKRGVEYGPEEKY